jgi:hypothetical protein
MNGKKIIVALGAVSLVASGVLYAGKARYMDSLTVAHKAKVGAGLVVNGGADINGSVNIPQGPLNVMNNKLKVDPSGVNVSGVFKVNGQSVGGSTGSVPAPFEVKSGATQLFRVDTNSSVNVGRNSSPNGGNVSLGNNASQVQLGNSASQIQLGTNCSNIQMGKSGGQVNINGTVKVNGKDIGSGGGGGTSGTVKGDFKVQNTGGSMTYFQVNGSSTPAGRAIFSGDAVFNEEVDCNKGETIRGDLIVKSNAADTLLEVSPGPHGDKGNGDVVITGNLEVTGDLTANGEPISGGGGSSGEVIGESFIVKENAEAQPVFLVNTPELSTEVAGNFRVMTTPGGESALLEVLPLSTKQESLGSVVVNGDTTLNGTVKLDPSKLTNLSDEPIELGGSSGQEGFFVGYTPSQTFDKGESIPVVTFSMKEGAELAPVLVELAYRSDTDSFTLCVFVDPTGDGSAQVIGGFAKINGSVVSDVTTAFEAAYDVNGLQLMLKTGPTSYSTGDGVLFYRGYGASVESAA